MTCHGLPAPADKLSSRSRMPSTPPHFTTWTCTCWLNGFCSPMPLHSEAFLGHLGRQPPAVRWGHPREKVQDKTRAAQACATSGLHTQIFDIAWPGQLSCVQLCTQCQRTQDPAGETGVASECGMR